MVCQAGSSSLRVSCSNRRDLESFSEVPNARHLPPRAGRLVDADGPGDSGRGPSASHDRRADRRTGPLAGPGADGHAAPRAAAADRADRPFPLRRELRSQRSRRRRPRFQPPSRSRRRRRRRPRPRGPSECTSAHTGSARRPTERPDGWGKSWRCRVVSSGWTSGRRVCGTASSWASWGPGPRRRRCAIGWRRRASRTASS